MSIRTALELVVIAVLSFIILDAKTELGLAMGRVTAFETAANRLSAEHKVRLEEARGRNEEEIKRLRDRLNEPVRPIRLCPLRPDGGVGSASNGASAPGGEIQQVPGRDTGGGTEPSPDIGGLLKLFAYQCERVSADLRWEQRVK
jgi:hypothetical protein